MSQTIRLSTRFSCLALAAALGACDGKSAPSPGPSSSSSQAVTQCPSTPAPVLFDNALCVCDDLSFVGRAVTTHALSQAAASVGVNGRTELVGHPDIDGNFVAWAGLGGVGDLSVGGDLVTTGELSATGTVEIGKDLLVGGNLMQVGRLVVKGLLRVAGLDMDVGSREIAGTGTYAQPASPPCGCDAATMFDVGLAVADAKATNDNATIGLTSAIQSVGESSITLPTGIYYLDSLQSVGRHSLRIEGAVSLYVGGEIELVGKDQIELAPGATLDLYVAGAVRHVGALSLGDAQRPSIFRLYVGGRDPVIMQVGEQELNGLIYAPKASVKWVGETTVRGAVFAGRLDGVGDLSIEYDGGSLSQPSNCDPEQPLPTPGADQPILVL